MTTPLDVLTSTQMAQLLDMTPSRVRQLCAAGRLQGAQRIGRDWMIPLPPVFVGPRHKPRKPSL